MSSRSVAAQKNHLPALIDRALADEAVVITRHGMPVVELKPIPVLPCRVTNADLAWVAARRVPLKVRRKTLARSSAECAMRIGSERLS